MVRVEFPGVCVEVEAILASLQSHELLTIARELLRVHPEIQRPLLEGLLEDQGRKIAAIEQPELPVYGSPNCAVEVGDDSPTLQQLEVVDVANAELEMRRIFDVCDARSSGRVDKQEFL